MMRFPPLYRRDMNLEEGNKMKKKKKVVTLEKEKKVRKAKDDKED